MTTITANIPDNLEAEVKKFIEELGGEIISRSKPSKKQVLLKELKDGLEEAIDIRDGKKQGQTLEEFLGGQ